NVQGAFRVTPEGKAEVAGRRLVLVDDVLTSGATVDACTRALLRGGAAAVDVLVFARVVAAGRAPLLTNRQRLRVNLQDLFWLRWRFTRPAPVPTATPRNGCWRARGRNSPRSTWAAIPRGEARWWRARMDA